MPAAETTLATLRRCVAELFGILRARFILAIALIIHGLFLTIGRAVDVTALVSKPSWRPMLMTKR